MFPLLLLIKTTYYVGPSDTILAKSKEKLPTWVSSVLPDPPKAYTLVNPSAQG